MIGFIPLRFVKLVAVTANSLITTKFLVSIIGHIANYMYLLR